LEGAVDIWCPNIGDFFGLKHLDTQVLAVQRKKGRETWWYTMAWPRYPYPTWLLDDDAAAIRIYGWLMAQHGITGFVYSMAHGWGPKPLENLQSFGETNGDGTLLYPAAAVDKDDLNPLPSIRLMLLRDAIEDYELRRSLPFDYRVAPSLTYRAESSFTPSAQWLFYDRRWLETSLHFLLAQPLTTTSAHITIDGHLTETAWQKAFELRRLPYELTAETTKAWITHNGKNLFVAARCPLMQRSLKTEVKGEWFGVDLAPYQSNLRYRFIVTPSGKGIIEKHTREGHFRIEGVKWKYTAHATRDFYNIEMQIPFTEVGLDSNFRFNARRRFHDTQLDIHYLLHAFADAEDVTLMPRIVLQ
jgi:hypothetical protein